MCYHISIRAGIKDSEEWFGIRRIITATRFYRWTVRFREDSLKLYSATEG